MKINLRWILKKLLFYGYERPAFCFTEAEGLVSPACVNPCRGDILDPLVTGCLITVNSEERGTFCLFLYGSVLIYAHLHSFASWGVRVSVI